MISTWVTLVCDDDDSEITSQSHLHAGLAAQVPLGHGHGEHVGVGHQRAGRQHCVVTRRGRHFRYIHILFKTAAFNQEKALVGAFSVITNIRMDLFEALVTSLLTLYHPLLPALACLCRHCQPVLGNMLSRIVVCDPGLAIQTAEVTRNAKLP